MNEIWIILLNITHYVKLNKDTQLEIKALMFLLRKYSHSK